ncbi:MAG: abortive phage resistance protein [Saprospiraceae bacterium]|nr:MAG: abortive phage resistance protein [Saprospiraceae bacterium]
MQADFLENPEREKFYQNLCQDVLAAVSAEGEEGGVREEKFTQLVLDMLAEAGETENARECRDIREDSIGRKMHKVNGYALSENYETLDLFVTIYKGGDKPEKIYKDELHTAASQCSKFLNNAIKGYADEIEESSPIFDLAQTLMRFGDELARANIFILTDGFAVADPPSDTELRGMLLSYHLRDLEYLWRLMASSQKRIPIEIDFEKNYGGLLPCLSVPSGNEDYESYLCILPGEILVAVYQAFGSRLLEQNVRSFLQFAGKINKGIRETILKSPHMFLAFNNGIAATAEYVELTSLPGGGTAIKSLRDLQIVNGGQTTASIFHTKRKDKADVSKVFVQMKLSVIKDTEHFGDIVSRISRYANTQNRVSEADLSSNHPFHVEMEKLSRNIWAPPAQGAAHQTRWFFERARGQYKDALNRELTPKRRKMFEQQNPRSQFFVKEDLAKFINSWAMRPWLTARGNQKSYVGFMKDLKNQLPDSVWFEDAVAKAILFRRAEKIYGVKPNSIGDIRYLTVPYTLAWLNCKTEGKLDLLKIWKNQGISDGLSAILRQVMECMDNFIREKAPGSLHGEWAKREECWLEVTKQDFGIDLAVLKSDFAPLNQASLRYKKAEEELEKEEKLRQVERLKSVPISTWKAIEDWGRNSGELTAYQWNLVFQIYKVIENRKYFTGLQISNGMKILDLAVEKKPELFFELDEAEQAVHAVQQSKEITLEIIRQIVAWDRRNKRLKDYEWNFMRDIVEGKKTLTDRNKFIAKLNWKKVEKYGFRPENPDE